VGQIDYSAWREQGAIMNTVRELVRLAYAILGLIVTILCFPFVYVLFAVRTFCQGVAAGYRRASRRAIAVNGKHPTLDKIDAKIDRMLKDVAARSDAAIAADEQRQAKHGRTPDCRWPVPAKGESMTITEFIAKHKLTMAVQAGQAREGWPAGTRHYLATLRKDGDGVPINIPFSMGPAYLNPPTIEQVLRFVASDCASYERANGDYEKWATSLKLDAGNQAVMRVWREVEADAARVRLWLGGKVYDELWQRTPMNLTVKVRRLVLQEPCPVGFFGKLRWRFLLRRQFALALPYVDDLDLDAMHIACKECPGWTVVSSQDLPGTKEVEVEDGESGTPDPRRGGSVTEARPWRSSGGSGPQIGKTPAQAQESTSG
jgi:hypothetical protein